MSGSWVIVPVGVMGMGITANQAGETFVSYYVHSDINLITVDYAVVIFASASCVGGTFQGSFSFSKESDTSPPHPPPPTPHPTTWLIRDY